jgi:hypothetical protein
MGRLARGPAAWLLLPATVGTAEVRDLGSFGATCPAPAGRAVPAPPRWIRVEPLRARVNGPADPPMPVATAPRTFVVPLRWPVGAPPILAVVGRDPASLAVVRTLPAGAPVLVVSSTGPVSMDALRDACPRCRIAPAGTSGARRLGILAVPAVIRVVDGVAHATEGTP